MKNIRSLFGIFILQGNKTVDPSFWVVPIRILNFNKMSNLKGDRKMTKKINLECVFDEDFEAWEVEVQDSAGNVEKREDFLDEEFEDEIDKIRKSYEDKGYKVEVNISGQ